MSESRTRGRSSTLTGALSPTLAPTLMGRLAETGRRAAVYSKIAWRNLWRNRRRTAVILTAIVLGVWSMLLLGALMRGMAEEMVENGIRTLTGHLQIHAADYRSDPVAAHAIADPEAVTATVRRVLGAQPWSARVIERVRVPVVLSTARHTGGATLVGIDPALEPTMSFIGPGVITAGRFLRSDGDEDAIVVGQALLDEMETELGHKLVLTAQDRNGTVVSRAFRVVGVYRAELEATEKQYVFVSRRVASTWLAMDGAVSEIAVELADYHQAEDAAERLRRALPAATGSDQSEAALQVDSWRELLPVERAVLDLYVGFIKLWFFVVFIAMGFGVVNTILMAVFERMREFGLLKALGMRPRAIVGEVLVEAVLLLLLGSALGNLLGWLSVAALSVHGIDLSAMAAGMELFGASRVVYPVLVRDDLVTANAVVLLLGVVVSVYPALKAARFTPVEAMRRV